MYHFLSNILLIADIDDDVGHSATMIIISYNIGVLGQAGPHLSWSVPLKPLVRCRHEVVSVWEGFDFNINLIISR